MAEIDFSNIAFDAKLVLMDSAQVFHWRESGRGFQGAADGRRAMVVPRGCGFFLHCEQRDVSFWRHYFDLDREYHLLAGQCEAFPMARRAVEMLPGMRILNQPPWEALVAFILSANNNVGRIRRLVAGLSERLGEPAGEGFPTPERLAGAGEEVLRAIGCGYRAPYLLETARAVAAGFPLEQLKTQSYEQAHATLTQLKGVGDKVADCVLLFGCEHTEAFPVDVWVERLMRDWFSMNSANKREMRTQAQHMFGQNAGLVQQYLFHCARLGLIEVTKDVG